jgi:DNA-binding NarL/FixJ family response regulator
MSVTVLLADNSILTRRASVNFLESDPEIHILAHAASLAETMMLASTVCLQVIVLDVYMWHVDRVPSSLIKLTFADSKVIAVSCSNDDETKAIAASYGVITLLDKTKFADELIPAIKLCTTEERFYGLVPLRLLFLRWRLLSKFCSSFRSRHLG